MNTLFKNYWTSTLFKTDQGRATTRGTKGGGTPLNKNFAPIKLPSMPAQTSLSLAAVSRWWLFFENQQRTRRKVDQIHAITFFCFLRSTENLVKTRQTQKFWPLRNKFCPLEQRSSCGTGSRLQISRQNWFWSINRTSSYVT